MRPESVDPEEPLTLSCPPAARSLHSYTTSTAVGLPWMVLVTGGTFTAWFDFIPMLTDNLQLHFQYQMIHWLLLLVPKPKVHFEALEGQMKGVGIHGCDNNFYLENSFGWEMGPSHVIQGCLDHSFLCSCTHTWAEWLNTVPPAPKLSEVQRLLILPLFLLLRSFLFFFSKFARVVLFLPFK